MSSLTSSTGESGHTVRGPPLQTTVLSAPGTHREGQPLARCQSPIRHTNDPARVKSTLPPSDLFTASSVHVEVFEKLILEMDCAAESL